MLFEISINMGLTIGIQLSNRLIVKKINLQYNFYSFYSPDAMYSVSKYMKG